MSIQEIDFSKTLNDEQVFETIMGNYSNFSKDWIIHQWNWMNNVYWAFKDHYKYMIIISLVEKTLQFYDQMQIDYSYDEYYSKSYLQIEKFSITELCEKLDLPKETVRRKVLELEDLGALKRTKKHISDPFAGSAAKRINMFLRWMVRDDNKGVDFGIWKKIKPKYLSCPLDIHSGRIARKIGILKRKQNDHKAVIELDSFLRTLDVNDPVKYDYALFGIGVFEKLNFKL